MAPAVTVLADTLTTEVAPDGGPATPVAAIVSARADAATAIRFSPDTVPRVHDPTCAMPAPSVTRNWLRGWGS